MSPESQKLIALLNERDDFRDLLTELEGNAPEMPDWTPKQPITESELAFYSGQKSGYLTLIDVLRGVY